MARYTGPKGKRARRLGIAVTDKQQRIIARRNQPPGMHGGKGYPRISEYGKQLQEKQRAKFIYGILERQFRNYFKKADRLKGDTGENLFRLLEMRLDNAVYRAGLTKTRDQSRQLVSHAHVLVNGKKVNVPSYQVSVGDEIEVKPKTKDSKMFEEIKERFNNIEQVSWINTEINDLKAKIVDRPSTQDMTGEYNPKLIIEFYSR